MGPWAAVGAARGGGGPLAGLEKGRWACGLDPDWGLGWAGPRWEAVAHRGRAAAVAPGEGRLDRSHAQEELTAILSAGGPSGRLVGWDVPHGGGDWILGTTQGFSPRQLPLRAPRGRGFGSGLVPGRGLAGGRGERTHGLQP